ncbi:purine-cytosine permease family protein [Serratia microhaemolytica]|uniref:purine-cytosine permease family protein n=1 Tax=Serratia microhaemolytica TaxID=2675110 RepID=UPI001F0B9E21|nr:cytosine permease [Serratia microhaemolytica]
MFSPIPQSARRPTWKQVLVWVGFGYVATGLFIGGTLAGVGGKPGMPFTQALLAIAIGMSALFVLTSLLGVMAQRTGLSLALISRYSYGRLGANLPMIAMGLLTLGWFAAITGMVGDIWGSFLGNPSGIIVFNPEAYGYTGSMITLEVFLACLIAGLLFTFTSLYGMKGLEIIAIPVSPIIMLIAVTTGVAMLHEGGGLAEFIARSDQNSGLPLSTAVTMVIGSWIAGAVMGVDLFRFNKSVTAVLLGAAACFIFTNPLLNVVGYIGTVTVGMPNYVTWMLGKSVILATIGVLTWTLSLWTTNDAELYCNSLYTGPVLDSVGIKVNKKTLILIVGILGTLLGSLGFYQILFSQFITYLGTMAPPLAGPLLADYYLSRRCNYPLDQLNKQPNFNWAGVISAVLGMSAGLAFSLYNVLPNWPTGLLALLLTIVTYALIRPMMTAKH